MSNQNPLHTYIVTVTSKHYAHNYITVYICKFQQIPFRAACFMYKWIIFFVLTILYHFHHFQFAITVLFFAFFSTSLSLYPFRSRNFLVNIWNYICDQKMISKNNFNSIKLMQHWNIRIWIPTYLISFHFIFWWIAFVYHVVDLSNW